MSAPDKIWMGHIDEECDPAVWFDADDGGTEYTRSDLIPALIAEAVAREREGCAKLVLNGSGTLRTLAAAIRARGKT
jgi:2-methylcitrate dehydratase PrpD